MGWLPSTVHPPALRHPPAFLLPLPGRVQQHIQSPQQCRGRQMQLWLAFAFPSKCTALPRVRSVARSRCMNTECGAGHLISPFTRPSSHSELCTPGTHRREEQDAFGGLPSIQSSCNRWLPEEQRSPAVPGFTDPVALAPLDCISQPSCDSWERQASHNGTGTPSVCQCTQVRHELLKMSHGGLGEQ